MKWAALIPVALAILTGIPALQAGFVWDDRVVLLSQVTTLRGLGDIWRTPAEVFMWSQDYFRPVVILSFLLDRAWSGDQPWGYHLTNVVAHAVAAGWSFALTYRLLAAHAHAATGALAASAIFAVHPIHTESVIWISARTDVLAAMFLLPAAWFALRWRDRGGWPALLLSGGCLFLALLSKEVALAGAVLLPAIVWLAPRRAVDGGSSTMRYAPWVVVGMSLLAVVVFFWLRSQSGAGGQRLMTPAAPAQEVWMLARTLAFYAIKAWVPWPQSLFIPAERLPGVVVTLGIAGTMFLVVLFSIRRWRARGDGVPLLALLWFGATIGPALAAAYLKVAEGAAAERYLYLPSYAVALACGAVVATLAARQARNAALFATVLVIGLSLATVYRARIWQSDIALWSDAVAKAPNDGLPLNELAVLHAQGGDVERAFGLWTKARGLNNSDENAGIIDTNIGNYYLRQGDLAQAGFYFDSALRRYPDFFRARRGMGRVLAMRAMQSPADAPSLLSAAVRHLRIAVEINPVDPDVRADLIVALARQAELAAARGDAGAAAAYREVLDQIAELAMRSPSLVQEPVIREVGARARAVLASGGPGPDPAP